MLFVNGEGIKRARAVRAAAPRRLVPALLQRPRRGDPLRRALPRIRPEMGDRDHDSRVPGPDDQRVVEAGGVDRRTGEVPRRPRSHRLRSGDATLTGRTGCRCAPASTSRPPPISTGYLKADLGAEPPLHRAAAGRHARLRARLRRGRPPPRRPRAGRRGGPADPGRRAARRPASGCVVDIVPNHAGISRPGGQPRLVGRAARRGPTRRTPPGSTSTGTAGRSSCRCSADDGDLDALRIEDGELRYYEHRYPIARRHRRRLPARGARPAALPSWSAGVAATPS